MFKLIMKKIFKKPLFLLEQQNIKIFHTTFFCFFTDIDEDMVTFVGTNTSYLFYDKTNQPSILNDTIVMSFRTIKMNALLLYMHDNYDNFVQLELVKENRIVLTFNSFDSVISASLECSRKHHSFLTQFSHSFYLVLLLCNII